MSHREAENMETKSLQLTGSRACPASTIVENSKCFKTETLSKNKQKKMADFKK